MKAATKYFNTSGPNIPIKHYTLQRAALLEEGMKYVADECYFTIWAPRQSGKSTYFRMLAELLEKNGYKVCYVNFENYADAPLESLIFHFNTYIKRYWDLDFEGMNIQDIFTSLATINDRKLVLVIDEVEGINKEYFNVFLHTIRNIYHSRNTHCLKSVILVGVSNITGIVRDNASPFNIADTLEITFFSREEVFELLAFHEKDCGQLFAEEVKEKIYEITAGQPGLVNGFAYKLVEAHPTKPLIEYADYLIIEKRYISIYIDKNISNIVNKARQHRIFVEKLLFTDAKIPFQINDDVIRELYVNGLIEADSEYNIIFRVPLYKKCLQVAFYPVMNGEASMIQANIDLDDYFDTEGHLNLDAIIRNYQNYAQKRGFRYFLEYDEQGKPKSLKEAALVYSFETFIQSYLQVFKGKSYLEPHVALGRSDLIINVNNQEFVIEAKIYYNITQFTDGKKQLAYYARHLGLKTAIYLVFVNSIVNHKKVLEAVEEIDGVILKTYLVKYDLETDF